MTTSSEQQAGFLQSKNPEHIRPFAAMRHSLHKIINRTCDKEQPESNHHQKQEQRKSRDSLIAMNKVASLKNPKLRWSDVLGDATRVT